MFAADHVEPYDTPEPDGCHCEQALQVMCDALRIDRDAARASLEQADREGYTLAQDVLQAVTLEEAKRKASIYLGLSTPF